MEFVRLGDDPMKMESLKERARQIVRTSRDPAGCLQRMRAKVASFFETSNKWVVCKEKFVEGEDGKYDSGYCPTSSPPFPVDDHDRGLSPSPDGAFSTEEEVIKSGFRESGCPVQLANENSMKIDFDPSLKPMPYSVVGSVLDSTLEEDDLHLCWRIFHRVAALSTKNDVEPVLSNLHQASLLLYVVFDPGGGRSTGREVMELGNVAAVTVEKKRGADNMLVDELNPEIKKCKMVGNVSEGEGVTKTNVAGLSEQPCVPK